MPFPRALLLALPLALIAGLMPARPAPAQAHPACSEVLRELTRAGRRSGGTPQADKVASKLGTDSDWVEQCAASYGRRVKPKDPKITENDEALTAKVEEREYQEIGREERDEPENYAQGDPDEYKDRDRVRGLDPDSSAEWEPFITHEWEPDVGHQWKPYILDDDDPGEQ